MRSGAVIARRLVAGILGVSAVPAMAALLPAALTMVVLGGCRSDHRTADDALRERIVELESQVRDLERRGADLERALREAQPEPGGEASDPAAVRPGVARIAIGRYSHLRDTDRDGAGDTLVVYVKPEDARGRFVQLAGTIDGQAAVVPARGEPRSLGQAALDAAAVRDAYRSSFTGTHYTLEIPIDAGRVEGARSCRVSVAHVDGVTRRRYEAEATVDLQTVLPGAPANAGAGS